jgi:hypothetical protein
MSKTTRNRGWISVPVLLLVVMLSLLLLQQQTVINDHKRFQLATEVLSQNVVWHNAYLALSDLTPSPGGGPLCIGFCSPSLEGWQDKMLEGQRVWLQRKRLSSLLVERWCASFDKKHIKCWWHDDSGAKREMWLTLP